MYQIICDDYILHDGRLDELRVIGAKCDLEVNKTGSLTFQIAPTHPYYDKIVKHKSEITLLQDDTIIFRGRVLNDEINFYNIKNVECEGELSYLLDSIQRYNEYHLEGGTQNVIETYLRTLINNHNSQVVDNRKRFTLGNVTVADPNNYLYNISNYEDTLSTINDKLIGTYGGYLVIRHSGNTRYLDYLTDCGACEQKIEFGENLIDMTRYIKGEDIFTALIPLGAKVDDSDSEKRVDIKSVGNTTSGTIVKRDDYIYDSNAVERWGWIWSTNTWDDVTEPANLFNKGKDMLSQLVNETFRIELTAIDLNLVNVDVDRIKIGDKIQCVSIPHNVDNLMIVESISIDIDNPANTKIQLVTQQGQVYTNTSSKKPSITDNQTSSDKNISDIKTIIDEDVATKGDVNDSIEDVMDWVNDNFYPTSGGEIELSDYAKIVDVNDAFDELALALQEV